MSDQHLRDHNRLARVIPALERAVLGAWVMIAVLVVAVIVLAVTK